MCVREEREREGGEESRPKSKEAKEKNTLPQDCAASVWHSTPLARHAAAIVATGLMLPISLFECITVTSTVDARTAAITAAADTTPSLPTAIRVTATLCFCSSAARYLETWGKRGKIRESDSPNHSRIIRSDCKQALNAH